MIFLYFCEGVCNGSRRFFCHFSLAIYYLQSTSKTYKRVNMELKKKLQTVSWEVQMSLQMSPTVNVQSRRHYVNLPLGGSTNTKANIKIIIIIMI